jgi:hypothetical protein
MTGLEGLLLRISNALERAEVPFMITGSFASAAHGLPRATQDLDIVIDPSGSEALEALLRQLGGVVATMGAELDRDYVERWVRALGLEREWELAQKGPVA